MRTRMWLRHTPKPGVWTASVTRIKRATRLRRSIAPATREKARPDLRETRVARLHTRDRMAILCGGGAPAESKWRTETRLRLRKPKRSGARSSPARYASRRARRRTVPVCILPARTTGGQSPRANARRSQPAARRR